MSLYAMQARYATMRFTCCVCRPVTSSVLEDENLNADLVLLLPAAAAGADVPTSACKTQAQVIHTECHVAGGLILKVHLV